MNGLFASLLSVLILFQSFGFSVDMVLKVSEIVEHARFHNSQYGDDLIDFLSKHYGDSRIDHERQHEDEKDEHEELPFKQVLNLSLGLSVVLVPSSIELPEPFISDSKQPNFIYKFSHFSHHLETQLRPPRHS